MVPETWSIMALGDCVENITSGGTPKIDSDRYYGGEIPFLKIDDLTNCDGLYVSAAKTFITDSAIQETSAKIYPEKTVLCTMYGTIGVTRILGKPMAANQAIAAFIGAKNVLPEFLAYRLGHDASPLAEKSGKTTQANISGRILKEHKILVPPIDEQRRIAAVLTAVDDAIQANASLLRHQELVFQEVVSRAIWCPSNASVVLLSEALTVLRNGLVYKESDHGVRMTRIETIATGEIDVVRTERADLLPQEKEQYRLHPGDILFSHINSVRHIGKVAFYDGGAELYHGMNLMLLRANQQRVHPRYLWLCLKTREAKSSFESKSKKAVNQASLNRTDIGSFQVPLPSLADQEAVIHQCDSLLAGIQGTKTTLRQMQTMKSGLLDDLLTGRVRVPDTHSKESIAHGS